MLKLWFIFVRFSEPQMCLELDMFKYPHPEDKMGGVMLLHSKRRDESSSSLQSMRVIEEPVLKFQNQLKPQRFHSGFHS